MADEQLSRLIGSERQIGGADLGELTCDAHARQWQTRVMAGRDHHPERGRRDAQELRDAVEDPRVPDLVQLVEHEDRRLVVVRERVGDQHREISGDHRERRHHDRLEPRRRAGIAGGERGQDRAPEVRRSVVVRVERHPREPRRRVAALDPRREQRGLARTWRSRDERQTAALDGRPEPLQKPFPAHRAMPQRRQPELRARNIEPCAVYRSRASRDEATRDRRGRNASRHAGARVASSAAQLNADHWHVHARAHTVPAGGAHPRLSVLRPRQASCGPRSARGPPTRCGRAAREVRPGPGPYHAAPCRRAATCAPMSSKCSSSAPVIRPLTRIS